MVKNSRDGKARKTGRTTGTRGRVSVEQAIIAVVIAAMDANQHVSREEAWRAQHIIESMRRFRNRPRQQVNRLIDTVRTRIKERGKDIVLREAVRVLPARIRPSAFAVAVDVILADAKLESAEKRFVKELAAMLKIQPQLADYLIRAMMIKNTV
jgi:tellurite resistance protein